MHTNEVILRGRIVSKYRQPESKWLAMTIAVDSRNGMADYPQVYWYGSQIDEVDQCYDVRDHVTVIALAQRDFRARAQIFVGSEIQRTPREMYEKFGVDTGRYLPDENEVRAEGVITNIFIPENSSVAIVTVRTDLYDNRHYYVQASCFRRTKEKVEKMQVNDKVCMLGHVQTSRRRTESGTTYFQTIVCHYIEKIEDEGDKEAS